MFFVLKPRRPSSTLSRLDSEIAPGSRMKTVRRTVWPTSSSSASARTLLRPPGINHYCRNARPRRSPWNPRRCRLVPVRPQSLATAVQSAHRPRYLFLLLSWCGQRRRGLPTLDRHVHVRRGVAGANTEVLNRVRNKSDACWCTRGGHSYSPPVTVVIMIVFCLRTSEAAACAETQPILLCPPRPREQRNLDMIESSPSLQAAAGCTFCTWRLAPRQQKLRCKD